MRSDCFLPVSCSFGRARIKAADEKMLQEIIREAELFLESQLTAGVAADQRAVTFASVLAATAAVLIGGYVAAATSGHPLPGLGWVAIPVAAFLLISTAIATLSCRPTDWRYPGNNPRFWREDATSGTSLHDAMADQAELYAKAIIENRDTLNKNSTLMKWAFRWAGAALVIGCVVALVVAA